MSDARENLLDPVQLVESNARIFVDTNVFMETRPAYMGGLKALLERSTEAILRESNPIVVPTKVQDELRVNQGKLRKTDPDSAAKAANALVFLASASQAGLVRTSLGDSSNPYADDLFLDLFERFATTYDMYLLTYDITPKLKVRLLAPPPGRRLIAGHPTKSGEVAVESIEFLLRKGEQKLANLHEKRGDAREINELEQVLPEFRRAFGLREIGRKSGDRVTRSAAPNRRTTSPFSETATIKPRDTALAFTALPEEGALVTWESASESGSLVLGPLLGEGGEGFVYDGGRDNVVKIFDKNHITRHRKEKLEVLVSRNLQATGLCIPSALVRNSYDEFVGYVMPKASGREARTIFNIRKLERDFPSWAKADLVDIAIAFLEKVLYLHSLNIIIGDINEKNLMIDDKKKVFIIDADSWQVDGYPCPVGTPMFTSPRMLGKAYSDELRTMEDELFAVATMLFKIVMTGQFPYMRTGTDGDMVQLIREGNFAFQYENRNNRDQPDGDWKFIWSHLHKPVKDLFWHTFHREGRRYAKRPTATEWLGAFTAYKAYLGNNLLAFDPMSNDVRPIRHKAFRPDTPIVACPRCNTEHAIAGIWNDDEQSYFVPPLCNKCRDFAPGRSAAARSAIVQCRDCGTSFPKGQAKYGRCLACAKADADREARAETLDPSRLCARCQKPFITYGNVEWHKRKGKAIPLTHKRGGSGTSAAGCVSAQLPPSRPAIKPSSSGSQPRKTGGLARIKKWFQGA